MNFFNKRKSLYESTSIQEIITLFKIRIGIVLAGFVVLLFILF